MNRKITKHLSNIYPKIKHVKGAETLKKFAKQRLLNNLEKVEEKEVRTIDEYDWDNLIILDGLRHDYYEE